MRAVSSLSRSTSPCSAVDPCVAKPGDSRISYPGSSRSYGCDVDAPVGWSVGTVVGLPVGWSVGTVVGLPLGCVVFAGAGSELGLPPGCDVGLLPCGVAGRLAQKAGTLSLPPASVISAEKAGLSSALPGLLPSLAVYAWQSPRSDGDGLELG